MQALQFLDAYSIRARLFPGLIAGAPLIWLLIVLVPWDAFGISQVIAPAAAAVLVVALADLARVQGKRIEPGLYEKWGGKPSTTMLRLSDPTLDSATKERYRAYLAAQLTATCPSAEDEAAEPAKCDAFYESCGNWLRERTRDTKEFGLLFQENITYGFRRNLYGTKPLAVSTDSLLVVGGLVAYMAGIPLDLKLASVMAIAVLHAGYISAFVTERSVREAAVQYGRQLLLSCDTVRRASDT